MVVTSLFLAAAAAAAARPASSGHSPIGFRVGLSRADALRNLSNLEIAQRAYPRDMSRLSLMSRRAGPTFSTLAGGDFRSSVQTDHNGDYSMNFSIGTPPVQLEATMDTGSDLIWAHCSPSSNQTAPRFVPAQSSSFSNISCDSPLCSALQNHKCSATCDYVYAYGDASQTEGYMASDTFTFGSGGAAAVPNVGFGCGLNNRGTGLDNGSRGVMGLGRGPHSLVSQLGAKKFSYCLSAAGSSLLVGSLADPNQSSSDPRRTTRLIRNPKFPTFYYVGLEGISVGAERLPIPQSTFEMAGDGSGGVIVDTGTSLMMISQEAYGMVRQSVSAQTQLELAAGTSGGFDTDSVSRLDTTGLDLCFDLAGKKAEEAGVPRLKLHLAGGVEWELPLENYMVEDREGKKMCLAVAPSGVLSVIGNMQQQNMLMVHDVEKDTLSIVPAPSCSQI